MEFEELISKGDFIPYHIYSEGIIEYMWDDWDKCSELVKNNKGLYIYTIISEENKLWVVEGKQLFNRIGYLFSKKYVKIKNNIEY